MYWIRMGMFETEIVDPKTTQYERLQKKERDANCYYISLVFEIDIIAGETKWFEMQSYGACFRVHYR